MKMRMSCPKDSDVENSVMIPHCLQDQGQRLNPSSRAPSYETSVHLSDFLPLLCSPNSCLPLSILCSWSGLFKPLSPSKEFVLSWKWNLDSLAGATSPSMIWPLPTSLALFLTISPFHYISATLPWFLFLEHSSSSHGSLCNCCSLSQRHYSRCFLPFLPVLTSFLCSLTKWIFPSHSLLQPRCSFPSLKWAHLFVSH